MSHVSRHLESRGTDSLSVRLYLQTSLHMNNLGKMDTVSPPGARDESVAHFGRGR